MKKTKAAGPRRAVVLARRHARAQRVLRRGITLTTFLVFVLAMGWSAGKYVGFTQDFLEKLEIALNSAVGSQGGLVVLYALIGDVADVI